jgi:hypothetical protein
MNDMNDIEPKLRPWFDLHSIVLIGAGAVLVVASWQLAFFLLIPLLLAGLVIYLGFALPRRSGWKERRDRAKEAKTSEQNKWGFHSCDREGPWLNYIDYPLLKETPIANDKYFYSEWLIIHNGKIIVNPGPTVGNPDLIKGVVEYDFNIRKTYAWDGCTPKRWFYWLALFGTPDWGEKLENITVIDPTDSQPNGKVVLWPRAHHASLVHDALCQYLDRIPISKKEVDQLFYDMLVVSGFPSWLAIIYYGAVCLFGGEKGIKKLGNGVNPNSNLKLTKAPSFLK